MSNLFLIEKYDDVTPIPPVGSRPDGMVVLPLDSIFVSSDPTGQDQLTQDTIRNQLDYIQSVNPIIYLHSMMQNKFYQDFCETLTLEQQNLVDRANALKTLFDIDFYDGDQNTFIEKTDNLVQLLNIKFPLFFVPLTNAENGQDLDIDKENDFRRVMVKKAWLLKRWAGTSFGYDLPMKLINRRGAVFIAVKYNVQGSVSELTDKVFRLIDANSLLKVLPGTSSTIFPNAGGLKSIVNISRVRPPSYKWDMGIRNDYGWKESDHTTTAMQPVGNYSPYKWDQYISLSSSEEQLFMEMDLDRLLLHLNSKGTTTCLADNDFFRALETMLPMVQRAQDKVGIGAQITLVASNDGKFNTLSGDLNYSHPNIHSKFQVFKYKEDKTTSNWGFNKVASIKVGQGGYGVASVDNNIFVKSTESPTDSSKIIPLDLQDPLFEMAITSNEQYMVGGYNLVSVAVHSREINSSNVLGSVLINGAEASPNTFQTTTISLADSLIARGTLSLGIDFDITIPELHVLPLASGLGFSSVLAPSRGIYTFDVTSLGSAVAPCIIQIGDVIRTITDVSSLAIVAYQIVNNPVDPITDPDSDYWNFAVDGTNITATTKVIEQHQRLLIYQQFNPEKNVYDPKNRWQERDEAGNYQNFIETFVPYGYTVTRDYSPEYFPEVRKNIVNLLPLTYADINPALKTGLLGWWDMTSDLADVSGNELTGTLYGTTSVTGIRGQGISFNGTSDYATIPVPTTIPKTISLWYKGTDAGGTSSSLSTAHVLASCLRTTTSRLFSVEINTSGKAVFEWRNSAGTTQTIVSQTTINDGQWHLITATHSGTVTVLYIDQNLEATNTSTSLYSASIVSVYVMKSGSSYSLYTSGTIDELRFYSTVLTSQDVKNLYTITPQLDTYLLDSYNNLIYTYINEQAGNVCFKLQYDPTGLLSDKQYVKTGYTTQVVNLFEKYSLGIQDTTVAVSEMGLYDGNNVLMAYATFPPVIYDASRYHLSFNLLIQKDS